MNAREERSESLSTDSLLQSDAYFRTIYAEDHPKVDHWFPRISGAARYSDAWLYITQACRGTGIGLGAIHESKDFFVGLGRHNHHWVLVRPYGRPQLDLMQVLAKMVAQTNLRMRPYVFVKKASEDIRKQLRNLAQLIGANVLGATDYPWDRAAPHDDDTFPERFVEVSDGGEHLLYNGENARRLRSKMRQYNAYSHEIEFSTVNEAGMDAVLDMIEFHFGSDRSNVESYVNMLKILNQSTGHGHWHHFVPMRNGCPVGLFAYEIVDAVSAGVYAAMAMNEMRGLAEAMMFEMFKRMAKSRIKIANLGGSETKGLDDFKAKFSHLRTAIPMAKSPICVIDFRRSL